METISPRRRRSAPATGQKPSLDIGKNPPPPFAHLGWVPGIPHSDRLSLSVRGLLAKYPKEVDWALGRKWKKMWGAVDVGEFKNRGRDPTGTLWPFAEVPPATFGWATLGDADDAEVVTYKSNSQTNTVRQTGAVGVTMEEFLWRKFLENGARSLFRPQLPLGGVPTSVRLAAQARDSPRTRLFKEYAWEKQGPLIALSVAGGGEALTVTKPTGEEVVGAASSGGSGAEGVSALERAPWRSVLGGRRAYLACGENFLGEVTPEGRLFVANPGLVAGEGPSPAPPPGPTLGEEAGAPASWLDWLGEAQEKKVFVREAAWLDRQEKEWQETCERAAEEDAGYSSSSSEEWRDVGDWDRAPWLSRLEDSDR